MPRNKSSRLLKTILLSLICLLTHIAETQAGSVKGRVTDMEGKPMALVTIALLLESDSSLLKAELTNAEGEYEITPVARGRYVVRATYAGYTDDRQLLVLNTDRDTTLPPLLLQKKNVELQAVAITAQKPVIEVHADKVVVNVGNSITATGGNALEVLGRAPGVHVDNSDNVSLKGKQGVLIMIDGKRQPLSGDELANMLKSMPASSIDQVELISNPSARYDAAGTAGIINIKLKKEKRAGLNGTVNGTYAQGIYGKANGGAMMNYREGKVNVTASYNHSHREGFTRLLLNRNFYNNGTFAGAYVQDNDYLYYIYSHTASAGIDYSVNKRTTIGATFSGDATSFRREGNNNSTVLDSISRAPVSHFSTTSSAPNQWNNVGANLNLRHDFDSNGTNLAVDADYAIYPSTGTQSNRTHYYNATPADTAGAPAPLLFTGNQTGSTGIQSIKADLSRPLAEGLVIETGMKASKVTSDHDLRFYNDDNGVAVADPRRTNHFVYHEQIQAGYVRLQHEGKKWSTEAGLRAEHTLADGKAHTLIADSSFSRNYTQLFPSMAVQRHLNANHDLGLTLSRRIERPSYDQLNPSTYYLDPTTYKTGDPYLRPELSYSAELTHSYKQKFITNLNVTRTSHPIVEVLQPSPTENKVTIQTQRNLKASTYIGMDGTYQFSPTRWWTASANVNIYYSYYEGNISSTVLQNGRLTFDANATNNILLPHNWQLEISGFYEGPELYGYMLMKQTWMLNTGIQKHLFDKKATARLNTTDIFWHGWPRATSTYASYVETFAARRDTRQISVSFTYRFGKKAATAGTLHRTGADDEKRRAGSQAG